MRRPGDEILVVDDGSTDDVEAATQTFGPVVRYLRTPHCGAGAARKLGVRHVLCDLVAFLDSDDEWLPGKLSLQRAVMAQHPEILSLFTDFAGVDTAGVRRGRQIATWRDDPRPWEAILGPGIPSQTLIGLPEAAPEFTLYVGSLYESLLRHWSVFTGTVIVRREEAGEALRFAEDVRTFEDLECYARLSRRGLSGYLDCETALQHGHGGARLTDADAITAAEAAIRVLSRVWGADADYLRCHRADYEAAVDEHRARKVRALLGDGRGADARLELAASYHPSLSLTLLTYVPGHILRSMAQARRSYRSQRQSAGATQPSSGPWTITEHRGRAGLEQLAADWERLYATMPRRDTYHLFEAHLSYFDHISPAPDHLRYLALREGESVRAICPLEARTDRALGFPVPVWGTPWHPHWILTDVICADDDVRKQLLPEVVAHLRRAPEGRAFLVLEPTAEESAVWEGLRAMKPGDVCVNRMGPADFFDCRLSHDELQARLSTHFRRNLRRIRKKLMALDDVQFASASTPSDLDD